MRIPITGANSGLGYTTAKKYLLDAGHEVILGCRDTQKAKQAVAALRNVTRSSRLTYVKLDLSAMEEVHRCATRLSSPVDVLICNAGVAFADTGHYSVNGIEATFATCHLGHFQLVLELLSRNQIRDRIIVVSSSVHDPEKSRGIFPAPRISDIRLLATRKKTDSMTSPEKLQEDRCKRNCATFGLSISSPKS